MYKIAVDHKGNKFKSKGEMCKYWGKSYDVVRNRLLVGWELKDALERQLSYNSKKRSLKGKKDCSCGKIKDHKGNEFMTKREMCDYWGVEPSLVTNRLKRGWSLEEALEIKNINNIEDHKGNKFRSKSDMCEFWGITVNQLRGRLSMGWSLKDALEVNRDSSIEDPKGNEFKDIKDMCKYWGKDYELVSKRLRNGWGIEDALEKPAGKYYGYYKEVEDHKGNKFRCIADMCEYWGVPYSVYNTRRKHGWSIEDALEKKIDKKYGKRDAVEDHKGNKFNSVGDMCIYWGVRLDVYRCRRIAGWSIERALESNVKVKV